MKHTIVALTALLVWLLINPIGSQALTIEKSIGDTIKILPTATPTSKFIINKEIRPDTFQLVSTAVPTAVVEVVTATPAPGVTTEIKPTPTTAVEPTVTLTQEPTVVSTTGTIVPTISPLPTNNGNNLTMWFLIATIGLLVLIVLVQAWPKKNSEDKS